MLSQSGPSTSNIARLGKATNQPEGTGVFIIDVTQLITDRVRDSYRRPPFSRLLGQAMPAGTAVEAGDILDITILEAPPAALFGNAGLGSISAGSGTQTNFAQIVVDTSGQISLPFVGALSVSGKSLTQIEQQIVARLSGKAHYPQALVRMARNNTSDVTIFGEVASSTRMPLTAKGERLLDALAAAGGVRQPVSKMTVQVARGTTVARMPLDSVIADPQQNVVLKSGDIVTALYQTLSFTALGATGKNEEIPFEASGITLAQALGRFGGLRDDRANAKGVFIFRLEQPSALDPALVRNARLTPDGQIPIVYQFNLRQANGLFIAQAFPIQDRDVIYVSNAGAADAQKFLSMVSTALYPITALQTVGVIK